MLYNLLIKYEFIFYGTLRTWENKPVGIELQPYSKTYHAKPYPVPRSHRSFFKKEVESIFQPGLLKK